MQEMWSRPGIFSGSSTTRCIRTPRALLHSHPAHQAQVERLTTIRGRVPSLKDLPVGCKFAPRCGLAQAVCFADEPPACQMGDQSVSCHAYQPRWQGKSPSSLDSGYVQPARAKAEASAIRRGGPAGAAEEVVRVTQIKTHYKDTVGWLGKILGEKEGLVRAVDGVDVAVYRGESLALVGESGSGKTTLGRTILRLEQPTLGEIRVGEQDITRMPQAKVRPLRARMQMIFQDPVSSLSPRKTVAQLLLEPFTIHNIEVDGKQKVEELLEMVGLSSEQADKCPHQLSGGQARRVGIAARPGITAGSPGRR